MSSTATVLLVSASATSTRAIGKCLDDEYTLLLAADAEQAWELLVEQREPSLVICELALAVDSFNLLERIRGAGDNQLAATPILLLVGESDSDRQREQAFERGATDFVSMPFASSELHARVRLHANLHSQHGLEHTLEMKAVPAVNVLRQLSRETFFNSRVQQELSFSARHRSNLGVARLCVDNIRAIVAGFDRAVATAVVQTVAKIAQQTLRREDTLCYQGKADFAVLFPATNGIGACAGVNRILERVAERKIRIAGKRVPVTLSAAVYSCIAAEDSSLEQIYALLEQGLAQAVEQGGGRLVSCSPMAEARGWSLDQVLKMIETGRTEGIEEHAPELLLAAMPLIEFIDARLELGFATLLAQDDARRTGGSG
ncbi:MAG: diguanylate cyclase [Gammaproteobacteria bacterium]|nr:diguanylate cyclase [Gammaproteobacteria bacterium]